MYVVFLSGITMLGYYSIGSRFPYNILVTSMIIETVVMTLYYICFWLNILDNTNATPTAVVLFGAFEFPNRMCLSGCYPTRTKNRSYISFITYCCSNFQYQENSMLVVFLSGFTMLGYLKITNVNPTYLDLFGEFEFTNRMCLSN